MNRTIRDILFFGAGVSAGVCIMHTLFQKKYRDYYDERYETERRHLQEREADMEKEIEEKATQKSFEQLAGKYRTESDPEVNADHEPIEIIQPDDFGGDDEYETCFLSYYDDGKLVIDGEDTPLDEDSVSDMIGTDALKNFGVYMPSTVHVRNHKYMKDYEILQVRQNFYDVYQNEEDE